MRYVRSLAEAAGSNAQLLAKIERAEAVETLKQLMISYLLLTQ